MLLSAGIAILQTVSGAGRPRALFGEPSYAGLAFYATAAGLLFSHQASSSLTRLVLATLFAVLGMATLAMHFIVFAVFVSVSLMASSAGFTALKRPRRALLRLGLLGATAVLVVVLITHPHVGSRLALGTPSNLSLAAWLQGLDQARTAFLHSPVVGLGVGATGEFPVTSRHAETLAFAGLANLNSKDAYSLAFRLLIETGLLVLIPLVLVIFRVFRQQITYLRLDRPAQASAYLFCSGFALTTLLGALLKEPLYPQSFLYVATFLLGTLSTRRYSDPLTPNTAEHQLQDHA